MSGARWVRSPVAVWALTRAALLLCVFKVFSLPGPDVTTDVSVIYRNWYEAFKHGTYPPADVTWQYPPGAALAILSPAVLPFLGYATAFFALVFLCDALVLRLLLRAAARGAGEGCEGRSPRAVWVWVAGVPLLGPTSYARYDLMVTAVAVAGLLAGARRPRVLGALAGFGALLKVWPVLLLVGTERGRATRRSWTTAAVTGAAVTVACCAAMPGALDFVTHQRDRGTEVESLGALVFQVARHFGWRGEVRLHYGSLEFMGPYVSLVSSVAMGLSLLALGWLVVWRLRAREFTSATPGDAAFAAVLLFTTTSRVISPQYMVWLVGLGAACLVARGSLMALPVRLVLVATGVTLMEFPIGFGEVVAGDAIGVLLLLVRNGLLVAASVLACRRLWRQAVPGRAGRTRAERRPDQPAEHRADLGGGKQTDGRVSPAAAGDSRATAP